MAAGLIILAEDDAKLRKMYADFLGAQGYTVVTAQDGEEALQLLYKLTPRVLILDIMMPGLDGVETCRRARKIVDPEVPILFLTATDNMETVKECLMAGGDDYMIKTTRLDKILERVAHWTKTGPRREAAKRRADRMSGPDAAAAAAAPASNRA